MSTANGQAHHKSVQVLAWMLLCVVFPLIWVGGLVTTTDAGMSVPDWPGTYGYNLLLYPLETWFFGPWDIFLEHGHRLLGVLAGLVGIALVTAAWWKKPEKRVKYLSVGILLAIIFQGLLGGIRVVEFSRILAAAHGASGPVVLALCAVLVTWCRKPALVPPSCQDSRLADLRLNAGLLTLLAYVQLLLGVFIRHFNVSVEPRTFRLVVLFHVVLAFILWGLSIGLARKWRAAKDANGDRIGFASGSVIVALMLTGQLFAGLGTWWVNFTWPAIIPDSIRSYSDYVVISGGMEQTSITTLHVALGSGILATAASLWTKSMEFEPAPAAAPAGQPSQLQFARSTG